MLISLVILALLVACSALMSGSETALFLVARDRHFMQEERNRLGERSVIRQLLHRPNRLLMTLLLMNLLVNLSFFAVSYIFLEAVQVHSATLGAVLSVVFLVVVLACGEILPKLTSAAFPLEVARLAARPVQFLVLVTSPVTRLLEGVVHGFNRLVGLHRELPLRIDAELLKRLFAVSGRRGVLEVESADLLEGIVGLRAIRLREVAAPRVEVRSCPKTATVAEALAFARAWGRPLIVLHRESPENIEGAVEMVQLLGLSPEAPVAPLARRLVCLPELAGMDQVLREFLERELQLALVVDEYGAMSGLVTRDEVIACLGHCQAGRIDGVRIIRGKDRLRELPLSLSAAETRNVTIGGFISARLDRLPRLGEVVEAGQHKFVVLEVTERGAERLLMIPRNLEERQ